MGRSEEGEKQGRGAAKVARSEGDAVSKGLDAVGSGKNLADNADFAWFLAYIQAVRFITFEE